MFNREMNVREVIITKNVASELDRLFTTSSILEKEIGGVLCHSIRDGKMFLRDVIPMYGSLLRKTSYSYDTNAASLASSFRCSNEIPVIFHTHPSGNNQPSHQDRLTSISTGWIGCIVAGNGISCYDGKKDIDVSHI